MNDRHAAASQYATADGIIFTTSRHEGGVQLGIRTPSFEFVYSVVLTEKDAAAIAFDLSGLQREGDRTRLARTVSWRSCFMAGVRWCCKWLMARRSFDGFDTAILTREGEREAERLYALPPSADIRPTVRVHRVISYRLRVIDDREMFVEFKYEPTQARFSWRRAGESDAQCRHNARELVGSTFNDANLLRAWADLIERPYKDAEPAPHIPDVV